MLRQVLVLTPAEVADRCEVTARAFRSFGRGDATCAEILACQLVATAMSDPESRSMSHVLDRTWGKVAQPIDVTGVAVQDVLQRYGLEDVLGEIRRRAVVAGAVEVQALPVAESAVAALPCASPDDQSSTCSESAA